MKNEDKRGNKEAAKGGAHKETWRCAACATGVQESLLYSGQWSNSGGNVGNVGNESITMMHALCR